MPWNAFVNATTFCRPVTLRASFTDDSTALVPDGLVNCSR